MMRIMACDDTVDEVRLSNSDYTTVRAHRIFLGWERVEYYKYTVDESVDVILSSQQRHQSQSWSMSK